MPICQAPSKPLLAARDAEDEILNEMLKNLPHPVGHLLSASFERKIISSDFASTIGGSTPFPRKTPIQYPISRTR